MNDFTAHEQRRGDTRTILKRFLGRVSQIDSGAPTAIAGLHEERELDTMLTRQGQHEVSRSDELLRVVPVKGVLHCSATIQNVEPIVPMQRSEGRRSTQNRVFGTVMDELDLGTPQHRHRVRGGVGLVVPADPMTEEASATQHPQRVLRGDLLQAFPTKNALSLWGCAFDWLIQTSNAG